MNWLFIALTAYLFLAVANLLDKFLVDNVLKSSKAYAFVACILGLLVLIAAPWFMKWPGFYWFFINIFTGSLFALALWSLYEALKRGEAAKTLVFIGGLTPVFSIILSIIFFKESYSFNQWMGMLFLLLGALFIAFIPEYRSFSVRFLRKLGLKKKVDKSVFLIALTSALFYSLYYIASKYSYNNQEFLSAFMWNRLGAGLFVLVFLIRKKDRQAIYDIFKKKTPTKSKGLVVFNQALGSSGFILQNYAISLGPVAIINALQGFQYAFLLVLSTVLALILPKIFKEKLSGPIMLKKAAAVVLIAIGLVIIAI